MKQTCLILLWTFYCLIPQQTNAQSREIDRLTQKLQAVKADSQKVTLLNKLSYAFYGVDVKQERAYAEQALELAQKIGYKKGEASAYKNIGVTYISQANYTKALEYYFKALKIVESTQDRKSIAWIFNDIGMVYYEQAEYSQALKYFFKGLTLARELNHAPKIALISASITEVYYAQKDYDNALIYSQKALEISSKNDNKFIKYFSMGYVGLIYGKKHEYDKAIALLKKTLAGFEMIGKQYYKAYFSVRFGNIYLQQGNAILAEKYLKQGVATAKKIKSDRDVVEGLRGLYQLYKAQGNSRKALMFHEQFILWKDSIFNQQKVKEIANLQATYEVDKKHQENELLRKDKEIQDKKLKASKATQQTQFYFLIAVSGASIFTLVFAFILFGYYRSKKKANALLTSLNGELRLQKDEISVQNEELYQQQEEILAQQEAIEVKNKELGKKNELIFQSLKVAKNIQTATFPSKERVSRFLSEYFVIYRPKDIVSGDFYWIEQVEGKRFVVAVDCTGHGVPGAFMSMVANTLLDNIIKVNKVFNPSEILDRLHTNITNGLKQEQTGNNSGMDVAICVIEDASSDNDICLSFAGAKRPLFYVSVNKKHTLNTLEGTRRSIGGYQNENIVFETQQLTLPSGSMFYIGSDGLADQNNKARKKFGNRYLKQILAEVAFLELPQQKSHIEQMLDNHMEDCEQRDDILLVGVQI
ncbi:tetratricopeptide repeat protein [uncultured Microscilla sp.]|uniref:tetratricopeptide repeat protein n=1 Tax=uncultured Microscilla sp. TaxID=432653 RepID=UPI0026310E90|nr:tetratricopeptide repeat protein [uncultured Microscilla sp.]